jgi:quinol monooxygenase YgiN
MQQNHSPWKRFFPSPGRALGSGTGNGLNRRPPFASVTRMSGVCPIVAYRPKPGRESELLELVRSRVPTLRREGLVTERPSIILRAKDGTIVEVSEWKSPEAIEAAHHNPNVLAMWKQVLRAVRLRAAQHARRSRGNVRLFRAAR